MDTINPKDVTVSTSEVETDPSINPTGRPVTPTVHDSKAV
jgi:hypothetical protein